MSANKIGFSDVDLLRSGEFDDTTEIVLALPTMHLWNSNTKIT